jgi:hypothetical protein
VERLALEVSGEASVVVGDASVVVGEGSVYNTADLV